MKKIVVTLSILLLALSTLNQTNAASTEDIAIIDINRVISASSQVKALEQSQAAKSKEFAELIKKAEADINKQKTEAKKKEVMEKYEKQIAEKRAIEAKEYLTKLKDADRSISTQVGEQAKKMGYKMVLPKDAVIFGGVDITEDVLKVIK